MTATTSFESVPVETIKEEIDKVFDFSWEEPVSNRDILINPGDNNIILLHPNDNREDIILTKEGVKELMSLLRIPVKFSEKAAPVARHEFQNILNIFAKGSNDYNSSVLLLRRNTDSDEFEAFGFKNALINPIPERQFFDKACDIIFSQNPEAQIDKFHVDIDSSSYSFLIPGNYTGEVRRDDTVHGGVIIENSWSMKKAPSVSLYLWRLICSNGMISSSRELSWKLNENLGLWESDIESYISLALEGFQTEMERCRVLAETRIDDPAKALSVIRNNFGIKRSFDEEYIEGLLQGREDGEIPIETVWDLLNVITARANTIDDPRLSRELQRKGGKLAHSSSYFCPACYQWSRN